MYSHALYMLSADDSGRFSGIPEKSLKSSADQMQGACKQKDQALNKIRALHSSDFGGGGVLRRLRRCRAIGAIAAMVSQHQQILQCYCCAPSWFSFMVCLSSCSCYEMWRTCNNLHPLQNYYINNSLKLVLCNGRDLIALICAGINTFRIPNDFLRICIRIEFEFINQEMYHVCVFVSVTR